MTLDIAVGTLPESFRYEPVTAVASIHALSLTEADAVQWYFAQTKPFAAASMVPWEHFDVHDLW